MEMYDRLLRSICGGDFFGGLGSFEVGRDWHSSNEDTVEEGKD